MSTRIKTTSAETHPVVRSEVLRSWSIVPTDEPETPPERQRVSYSTFTVTTTVSRTPVYMFSRVFLSPDWLRFQELVSQWHRERGATSFATKMAMCPSYQRIIAMGENAIPLILRQLENEGDEPDHWFWALSVLTGADPVPDEARGDIRDMAKAWLEWARTRYAW